MSTRAKPSRLRQKEDVLLAQGAIIAADGAPYSDAINPYLPPIAGAPHPARADRFRRFYEKEVVRFHRVEARVSELRAAYGIPRSWTLLSRMRASVPNNESSATARPNYSKEQQ